MTVHLCNAGVSAAQAILSDPEFLRRHLAHRGADQKRPFTKALVAELGGIETATERLRPFFLAFDHQNDSHLRDKLSAEIHSLVRSNVKRGDRVFLLASDTDEGEVGARLSREYLTGRLGLDRDDVLCRRVEGMQVADAERFRREGVPNYFRIVLKEGERCGWYDVVLHPTAGYKALVPYATLLGMLFGVPVRYIFERSPELLELPPLPVEIDRARLQPILPALQRFDRETDLAEDVFWGKTPFEDRQRLAVLVAPGAGAERVTLSEIGLLVYERLQKTRGAQPLAVYLSRRAWDQFTDTPPGWGVADFLRSLRTAADVDRYRHSVSDGSLWLKAPHTPNRFRVELEGDRLLVYEILGHDAYERAIGRDWRRSQYRPFTRFDVID
jgi:putative CRISPR-associated protein (TIGR02619 family)